MLFRFWVFPDCTFLDISNTVLSHYAGYIRYFSKMNGQVNAEVEEYVKQQLIAALFKFRFDR